jgi:hypothetical protein
VCNSSKSVVPSNRHFFSVKQVKWTVKECFAFGLSLVFSKPFQKPFEICAFGF